MDYWFTMWYEDKKSIINTMAKNIAADLEAGYDPLGNSIVKQRAEMDEYIKIFDAEVELLKEFTPRQAERWCKLDMLKRGAIEL